MVLSQSVLRLKNNKFLLGTIEVEIQLIENVKTEQRRAAFGSNHGDRVEKITADTKVKLVRWKN